MPEPKKCPFSVVLENVTFAYGGNSALKSVSLEVRKQERFGIIGPSGAGKSTLLLHLNGLLRGEGRVIIEGLELRKENLAEIRKRVGLVFQNPDDQLFNPTVEEDIAFGLLNMEISKEKIRIRIKDTLRLMNLEGLEGRTSHHLSFGERKRVALATVLAMQPDVIAFDEPFSNLDPATIKQFIKTIKDLDATVLIVSQQILPVLACCDRIAVMNEGTILKVGSPDEIMADKTLLRKCRLDISFYADILSCFIHKNCR